LSVELEMNVTVLDEPLHIHGLAMRTSNERAFDEIPRHWERFHREWGANGVPGRTGGDLYALYTDFEHPGVDNRGDYAFVIGAQVRAGAPPTPGLVSVTIPRGRYVRYEVARGHPERVGERWRDVWADGTIDKSFRCDYERYQANGDIAIHVGVR
jgi:predicted transcriptional regulator YdeE